jgi:hypothetical protein
MTTKKIEKKMGDEFMTVILSFGKIKSSLRAVTRMMQDKEFTDADIKAYVANLVEEAIASNMKELSK